ncbi:MAG: sigma 54-interacting transcriptional regulator [Candidatus Cloacimonas sp.]|nr:sigma 54-interacting transcriptional regulator [Candidatus Cloacimonas sp.]
MREILDNETLKELEQLAEAYPLKFMQQHELISKQTNNEDHRKQLQYLYARALVTMNQKGEAEEQILVLLSKAVEQGDHLLISKCNIVLSKCVADNSFSDKKNRYLDIAYDAARKSGNNRVIAECLVHFGVFYTALNDRTNALKAFTKAERLCEKLQDADISLQLKIGFGSAYYKFGEHLNAVMYLTDALQLSVTSGDINRQLLIINNLSTLYSVMSRFEEAEKTLQRGIKIAETNDIPMRKVLLLFNLGVLSMRCQNFQPALDQFLETMHYAEAIGFDNPQFRIELYSNLAGCYRYVDDSTSANEFLVKAEELAKHINSDVLAKEIELNRANLLMSMGALKEAKKLLQNVSKYFRKHKLFDQLIVTQLNLAEYYEIIKDFPNAIKHLKAINPIYLEYMSTTMAEKTSEFDKQIKSLLARFDQVQKNYDKLASQVSGRILGEFVGCSNQHKKVLETAMMAAQHPNASILITGESGTGKDVVANLIHMNSIRKSGPFVAVNVSAITPSLIESELFGHCKGSFTGAVEDHKGFFQQANHGTLFLDEIGDMPKDLQSKLLRVLESRKVTPVGSAKEIPFDCRIISSTNRDLESMLKDNLFRLDLFHRLNTLEISISPLRNRSEDVIPLIEYYSEVLSAQNNRKKPVLDSSFLAQVRQHPFPGNVRELKNMIERLFILCPDNIWDDRALAYLGINRDMKISDQSGITQIVQQTEKDAIIKALNESEGKQKDAARVLNMSESTLTRKIEKYSLEVYTRKGR